MFRRLIENYRAKKLIKSLLKCGIDINQQVAYLIYCSYSNGNKEYKTLDSFVFKYKYCIGFLEAIVSASSVNYHSLIRVLDQFPIEDEEITKLVRLAKVRGIRNDVLNNLVLVI